MISREVRDFLAEYIDAAESLDILMLLHREPAETWTPETVSNRVFTVPQAAERRLEELAARGLVAPRADQPGAYAISLPKPEMAAILAELKAEYEKNRAEVIGILFKLKADPLKSFSNAFRLRGDS